MTVSPGPSHPFSQRHFKGTAKEAKEAKKEAQVVEQAFEKVP
jgi:hypothetical protein